eukprot:TRINITY_DN22421_c0_g1_i7.p2 TRINITY_DN22421_c0_g1~~TRINITY_DN22421_c0_g1_i7.p2  ORF type:complete len:132 (-),score=21.35 TRINITY_DN22421_c0_g1_i7:28-423(-)
MDSVSLPSSDPDIPEAPPLDDIPLDDIPTPTLSPSPDSDPDEDIPIAPPVDDNPIVLDDLGTAPKKRLRAFYSGPMCGVKACKMKAEHDFLCRQHYKQTQQSASFKAKVYAEIGRAVQQECRDRSRMPSSA